MKSKIGHLERLMKLINLVVSHTFLIGSLINFPLETSSLSFYPDAMSEPVLLSLHRRDILKDMEWAQSTKHRLVGEKRTWWGWKGPEKVRLERISPLGPCQVCRTQERSLGSFCLGPGPTRGQERATFLQKTEVSPHEQ